MHSKIAENVDSINEIFSHFETQRDDYGQKNGADIAAAEAAAAIEAVK
jgi:hypothetical protein